LTELHRLMDSSETQDREMVPAIRDAEEW
jgi:hypothetical protein